ncbi:MAG: hypothetical protein A3K41_07945 [Chloroflexi bacterium RIFOXYD12_FULL_57_15]|nr:MAG: hypothetical protein A3K41_07945 [Chloroflexi bacterium RIFOXYD12_FULL_57_15]
MVSAVPVREQGQVDIPVEIQPRLKIKRGDMVAFVETESGIVIKPLDEAADGLLEDLRKQLNQRGISLDALLERCLQDGAAAAAREFDISDSEKETLLNALFMRAQISLSRIQAEAKLNGTDKLTDEEIEAEIQAVRREKQYADRP